MKKREQNIIRISQSFESTYTGLEQVESKFKNKVGKKKQQTTARYGILTQLLPLVAYIIISSQGASGLQG